MHANYPLFPLPLAAMPCARLALQIFEPRYLDLVKTSVAGQQTFGIVMLDQSLAQRSSATQAADLMPIGTAVRIVDFSQQANGLLGIVCEGLYKFKLHDAQLRQQQIALATIETLAPEQLDELAEDFFELIAVLQALLQHPYAQSVGYQSGRDEGYWHQHPVELSWQLAALLPVPEAVKYSWLAMDDTQVRLASFFDTGKQIQGAR